MIESKEFRISVLTGEKEKAFIGRSYRFEDFSEAVFVMRRYIKNNSLHTGIFSIMSEDQIYVEIIH